MNILDYKWWKQLLIGCYYEFIFKQEWTEKDNYKTRKMKSYDEYLRIQKAKLNYTDLTKHSELFYTRLKARIHKIKELRNKQTVLCLGARDGTEVKAFRHSGFFSWGIDLNHSEDNQYVTKGDFHSIDLMDNTVDIIYTNSLDHVFDIDKFLEEVNRLLKRDGIFYLECNKGYAKEDSCGLHEATVWKDIPTLINTLKNRFVLLKEKEIDYQQFKAMSMILTKKPIRRNK